MQIASVATMRGVEICAAASRMADGQRFPEPQVAVHVLHGHDRVVDEQADRQRQPTERHHVEAVARGMQDDDRQGDRERYRHDRNEHAPPASHEEQDHEGDQDGRDDRLADDARYGRAHEDRLVEVEANVETRRRDRANPWKHRLGGIDHRERRGIRLLENRQIRAAAPVDPHDVLLLGEAIAHRRDVADQYRRPVDDLDRDVVEVGDVRRARVHRHVVVAVADTGRARGDQQVRRQQRAEDILGRQPFAGQRLGIHIDRDLAQLAAVRRRRGEARDREEVRTG